MQQARTVTLSTAPRGYPQRGKRPVLPLRAAAGRPETRPKVGVDVGVGMANRQVYRLSVKQADALRDEGRYLDGNGLILQITKTGSKSWILKFRWGGKFKELGLGAYRDVGLKAAREKADEARRLIADGVNPIEAKRTPTARKSAAAPLFGPFAMEMIAGWRDGWKNPKHAGQWDATIRKYAAAISAMPVDRIDTADVMAILRPLWTKTPETARRVRGRIERVLDAAKAMGHRSGENPARWGGHLEILLAPPKRLTRGHQQALAIDQMPDFMRWLREQTSISAQALEITILTASRTAEVQLSRKSEFDLDAKVWIVPAERTKAGRVHRVPLQDRAVEVLRNVFRLTEDLNDYAFPGRAGDGHLSNMAMLECLRGKMGMGATVHGFRSTFRDWAGDETDHPREIAEAALGHVVGDKAEQAYRRGDALERRRRLMDDWAARLAT